MDINKAQQISNAYIEAIRELTRNITEPKKVRKAGGSDVKSE